MTYLIQQTTNMIRRYRFGAAISVVLFFVLLSITVGVKYFSPFMSQVQAAAVTYTGASGGDWCLGTNWSGGSIPTSVDDVTIDIAGTVDTSDCANGQVQFNTLTIGGTNAATFKIDKTLGTAGSVTVANLGVFEQNTTSQLVISGTFTVQSGGTLKHSDNSTTQAYEVDISAANIDIQSGGSVNVDGLGYDGGTSQTAGSGPGGGSGTNQNSQGGGGGAHGGNGGLGTGSIAGGTAYCTIANPSTIGSGGGATNGYIGGNGGGLIILTASDTVTINGTVTADGGLGTTGSGRGGGGGAGGGINITAATIAGTPASFTATGGAGAGTTYQGGGGGGGCVLLSYTSTNSISSTQVTMSGGDGDGSATSQWGGAGQLLIKQGAANGDLYLENANVAGAVSPQSDSSLTVNSITLKGEAEYTVGSGKTLVLPTANPFSSGDGTGVLRISGTATFTPTSTTSFTIASTTLELSSTATLTASSSLDFIIGPSESGKSYLDLRNYTTSSALTIDSLVVKSGGTVTHGDNSTAQTHVVNIQASTIEVQSGGFFNVDEKGYDGGTSQTAGSGPGGGSGTNQNSQGGGGGAHGGNGGLGTGSIAGGTAYCTIANPSTIGSGGGATNGYIGGNGGGLIILTASDTVTINGTVTADGGLGTTGSGRGGGGGAGGGINITAATIAGTPASFTATGGAGAGTTYQGGGGGGGCVYVGYRVSSSISSGNITSTGGTAGGGTSTSGSDTTATVEALTPSDPTTLYTHSSNASSGDVNPTNLSSLTPVFSALCNTPSGSCISAEVEVDDNSDFSSPVWQSGAVDIADIADSVRSGNIAYAGSQLNYNTTYYWRIRFTNDIGTGLWSTETATFYVPRAIELYTFNYGGSVQSGETVDILWGSSAGESDETVKIEYSTNDFSSATTIVASTSSLPATSTPHSYSWLIPDANTVCGLTTCSSVKIRISSNNDGNSYAVTSAQSFTIQDSSATGIYFGADFASTNFYTVSSTSGFTMGGSATLTAGYARKKAITVTNNVASELSNFQVKIQVAYDADMQGDFDDIRFYASDETTELDYWLETKTDSTSATFWVEVPTIPASSATTIYMFYGNSSVSSSSNGEAVFPFFDTFDSDPTYSRVGPGNGTYTVSGGTLTLTQTSKRTGMDHGYKLDSVSFSSGEYKFRARFRPVVSKELHGLYFCGNSVGYGSETYFYKFAGSQTYGQTPEQVYSGSGLQEVYGILNDFSCTGDISVMHDDDSTASASSEYDWVFLHKHVASDPGISFGSEVNIPFEAQVTGLVDHSFTSLSSFTASSTGSGTVKFQISGDAGSTWYYCVGNTLTSASYTISNASAAEEITDACLSSLNAGNFLVRAFLLADVGQSISLQSYSFLPSNELPNTAPAVTIGTPSQQSGTTVTVTSTLTDADSDTTSLIVEYSTDGTTWTSSTLGSITVDTGSVTTSTGQISSIDTFVDGSVDLTIEWNIGADLPNTDDTTVYLRLIPNDGTENGSTVTSTAFAVDTLDPTAPGDLSVYTVTSSTIQLTFPVTNASDTNFSEYKIFYASSTPISESSSVFTSTTDANLADVDFNAATQSVAFSGFSASTTYYFKLYAYDTWGNSTSSAEISTTTLPAEPTAPTITSFTNVTSSSLTINWQDNSSGNTQETGFTVRYGTSIGNYTVGSSSVDADVTTVNISGLTASTTYYFVVEATNSGGTSTSSYSSTTTVKGSPAAPTSLTFSSVSTTTLTIFWTDTSFGSATAAAETFTVKYNTDGSGTYGSTAGTTNSGTNSLDVTLSTPNSTYYFVVIASNNGGTSTSSLASTTTLANVPTSVSASAASTSSISVSWNANSNPAGTVYQVYNVTNSSVVATTTDTSLTVSSLSPNVAYQFKVRAENSGALGTYSAYSDTSSAVYTLASSAGQPTASNATTSTIDLVINTNGNSASTTYAIYNETSGNYIAANGSATASAVYQENGTWGTVTVSGLSLNTSYQFSVIARNGDGVNAATSTASTAVYTLVNTPGAPTVNTPSVSTLNVTLDTNSNPASATYAIYNETSGNYIDASGVATSTAVYQSNATWGTVTVSGLSKNVAYQFSALAQNSAGVSTATSTASMAVYTLAAKPLNPTVDNPQPTSLDVTITGSENGNSSSTEYAIYSVTFDAYITALGATSTEAVWQTTSTWGTVTVSNLSENTSYSFKIKARNGAGTETLLSDPTAAYTGVGDPDNFQAIIINTSTITFTVSSFANDDQPNSGYCFYQTTCAEGSGWMGTNTWEATGLTANTQYSFYVKYRNGDSIESNTTTLQLYTAATPPGAPTLTADSSTSFSVEMNTNGNPADTTYALYNVTSDTYYDSNGALSATAQYYTSSTWAGVTLGTGFSVNTPYTFQAYARNGNNIVSDASATSTAYTLSATPSVPTLSSITSSSLQIALGADSNPVATEYAIRIATSTSQYVQANGSLGANAVWQAAATWGTVTVSGLSASTTYTVDVKAKNGPADGTLDGSDTETSFGTSASATTLKAIPPAPTGLSFTDVTDTTLTISWTDNANGTDNEEDSFVVRYGLISGTYTSSTSVGNDVTSTAVSNLSPNQAYYFVVEASNNGGTSTSTESSTTTLRAAPAAPSFSSFSAITSSTLTINWTNNTTANDLEDSFVINYGTAAGVYSASTTANQGATSVTLTGLSVNTTYYLQVVAINVSGEGSMTEQSTSTLMRISDAPTGLSFSNVTNDAITLSWTDNGSVVDNDEEDSFTVRYGTALGVYDTSVNLSANTTSTIISVLSGNDEYFFVVDAVNGSGTSTSAAASTTTLHDAPAAPSAPTFTNITSSSLTINWVNNTTDADRESSLVVYYSTSTDNWTASSTLGAGETSLAVTGLDASTTYYAKVQAINESGSSESASASTTTLSAVPSAPMTLEFSSVASSSVHISWVDTSSGTSAATSFRISYGILSGDYSQGSTTVVSPTTSTTVTGLLANQVYYFVVTAVNNGGEATSTEASVITLREVSPAPTISSISNNSSSGFTVNWADNSTSNRDNEQSFVVRYGTVEGDYSGGATTTVADTNSAVISGLSPNTTYYLVVEAVNNGGTSTSTATSTVTLANTPGAPTFGSFSDVTCSAISLNWTNNTTSSTLEDNVIVYYGLADDVYTASSTLDQGSTTTTISSLNPGTAYYFQISAVNGTGEASTSETLTTTTLYCTPDAPTNVNLSSITSESIVISWDDNGSTGDGDQEDSYLVRYGTTSGNYTLSQAASADATNATILGLNPLTEYFFVVDAINNSGTGTSAESSTSTTVGSPTAPDITSIGGVGTDVFTVYWTDNSSGENQEDTFYVYWGTSGDTITSGPIDAGQDATSTQITGLTANQQYYVTVVASNINGNSTSTPDTTTTLPLAPAAPSMGSATGVTSSSITVNWTNNAGQTDAPSSIAIIYGTSTLSYTATSTVAADVTSKTITGLDPNQAYYFKVVAINVSGQAQSDEGSATTLKVIPPQASYLILSSVDAISAILSWTDNAELSINEEESITVAWGTALGNYTTGSSTLDVNITSTTISGLTPNQTYYFVVTYTNNGGSSTSDSVSTTTIRNASAAPTFVSFTNVSTSGFTINWTNNTTNADIEDSFIINYGTSTMTYTASTTAVAGATSKAISGLSANTTYYVQVVAVNTSGQGEMSEQFQATLAESSNSGSGSQSQPSSGGGSAPPPAPPAPPTSKPVEEVKKEVTRGYGQPVSVTVNGKQHTVVVSNIADDGRTTIQIFSEPKTVVLYPSGESLVDVDEDGTPDLYMKLKSADATLRTASLQIVTLADLEFAINNHLTETNNRFVVLNFNSPQADQIAVSNKPNFANASFEPYVKTRQWLLPDGDGKKTVYVKLRTKAGGEKVLTASINLKTTGTTTEPVITCPLTIGKAYKSANSSAVYYVTKPFSPVQTTCTKRPFKRSDVFFTYFSSWSDVKTVSFDTLDDIPNDQLGFMPWGPKFDPKYGALVKTVNDPAVYLLLGTEKYWITSEEVFEALGYKWDWIEDVDERVLDNYELGTEISYTDHHPNYTLIKYPNSPKVYRLEPNPLDVTKQVKRHIVDEKAFLSLGYRWDRIVEIGVGEVYEEGEELTE